MIDFRIYRAMLLPALLAITVMMFSLGPVPEAKRSRLAPSGFDGARVAALAGDLAALAPDRRPGSAGDARVAAFVRQRFGVIQGGQLTEQRFHGEFRGRDVEMSNVILTLPGQSDRRVVLIAHRDESTGPGLASSAAATAALLEIGTSFSGSTHSKTLVLVSSDGGSAAAAGAKSFAQYPNAGQVDAVVSLEQPGLAKPRAPFVVPWSTGSQSTSVQLARSAHAAVRDEVGGRAGDMGTFGQLVQLALPSGLGEQGVLIERGFDAISLSSAGERPLAPAGAGPEALSADTLGQFGRATLALMLALDGDPDPLEHGPETQLTVAGSLLPGWTLRLLALTLILPIGAVAVDGAARLRRRGESVLRPLAWVAARALPFAAAVIALYLCALVRLLPAPEFPFDVRDYDVGTGATVAIALASLALGATTFLSRPRRPPPIVSAEALFVSVTLVMSAALLALWLANPFLALLFVPALHLWQAPSLPRVPVRLPVVLGFLLAGLVLPILAVAQLADRFGLGGSVLWDLALQLTGGQIGPGTAFLGCLLAGCGVATLALARAIRRREGDLDVYANRADPPNGR
ncbi:MAG: hypothetical protein QOG09_226 [Solirubrobacterales bacterium]|jgi:hypothetical protein|nr:hypothetical protein [Solirubrobacterales bacterium]